MTLPLRLAIVTASASRSAGGLFNSVRMGALALRERGHDVRVLARESEHDAEDLKAWAPIEPTVGPPAGPAALGYVRTTSRALRDERFDVAHHHGVWEATTGTMSRWRARTGGRTMISPRGMLDPWALANSGWKKRLAGWLHADRALRECDCLHALNRSEARSMRRYGLANPIAIVPNGTHLPERRPRPPADGPRTLLFIGRIHPKKGVAELIEAWAELRDARPDLHAAWRLVIAGWDDGGHLDGLRELARRRGVEVDFPGPVFGEAKEALLREAGAFVLPSHSEGLPMSVLEAWAYELPVLMSEACNLPEGFAAEAALPAEPEGGALAAQLARALGRDDLAAFGQRGRALVERAYAWPAIAATHERVYRWMLDGGDVPDCVETGAP